VSLSAKKAVPVSSDIYTLDSRESGLSYSEQHTGRPLLTPDEVRNLPESRALLFPAGKRPILARKLRYYADAEFARLYDRA
jgi:type IV secretion system protein VirD4